MWFHTYSAITILFRLRLSQLQSIFLYKNMCIHKRPCFHRTLGKWLLVDGAIVRSVGSCSIQRKMQWQKLENQVCNCSLLLGRIHAYLSFVSDDVKKEECDKTRGSLTSNEILKTVAGTCLVHSLGYWTVKLCHQQVTISWFHNLMAMLLHVPKWNWVVKLRKFWSITRSKVGKHRYIRWESTNPRGTGLPKAVLGIAEASQTTSQAARCGEHLENDDLSCNFDEKCVLLSFAPAALWRNQLRKTIHRDISMLLGSKGQAVGRARLRVGAFGDVIWTLPAVRSRLMVSRMVTQSIPCTPAQKPVIADFKEPNKCEYHVRVCLPALCKAKKPSCRQRKKAEETAPKSVLRSFYALNYGALVAEGEPDMLWTMSIRPVLSLSE